MEKRFKKNLARSLQHGVSLIELMVVVAILGVIATIAAPNLSPAMKAWNIKAASGDIQLDISTAKSEAGRQNMTVTMCGGSVQEGCTGNWSEGRIIFIDSDASNDYSAGDDIIKQSNASKSAFGSAGTGSLANGVIRFRSTGMPIGGEGALVVCDERIGAYGTSINVANVGNPKLLKEQMCGG